MTNAAPRTFEAQQQHLSGTVKTGLLLAAPAALVVAGGYVLLRSCFFAEREDFRRNQA